MSDVIERIKVALKADPYLVSELGAEDGVEHVQTDLYDQTRWGTVHLAVFRDLETGDLAGVLYETVPEEGLVKDEIQVVRVEARQATTYVATR